MSDPITFVFMACLAAVCIHNAWTVSKLQAANMAGFQTFLNVHAALVALEDAIHREHDVSSVALEAARARLTKLEKIVRVPLGAETDYGRSS